MNADSEKKTAHKSDKVATEFECVECTQLMCKPVTFKDKKSLQRHLTKTKRHNAPPILRCSCGKAVVRKDAMYSHREYCRGTTLPV